MVIAGPTAVGKTSLAIQLARHYGAHILSADSRQFYREMSIGTAKPGPEELAAVPHHFINTKSVGELYGAGHFEKDALEVLEQLYQEHALAIVVGGSGLYLDALLHGVDEFEEVPGHIRQRLNNDYADKGLAWLQEQVREKDPVYFETVDTQNPQRLIRALEVCLYTGKPFSQYRQKHTKPRPFEAIPLLLNTSREVLYHNINRRVDDMMANGLLDEVKRLLPYQAFNALKTVGYRELFEHLQGTLSLEEAVDKIKQHSRNYAKRQITWFKNKGEFEVFEPQEVEKIKAYIDIIMANG